MPYLSRARAIRHAGVVGVVVAIAAVAFAAGLLYRSQRKATTAATWVDHTHRVIENLEELQTAVADVEGGERDYLLTGRATALRPYRRARARAFEELAEAGDSTRDNVVQQRRLRHLDALLRSRFKEVSAVVVERENEGADVALARLERDENSAHVDSVNWTVEEALREERGLLDERAVEAAAQWERARRSAALALALGLVLALASFGAVRYEAAALAAAEAAARESEERYRLLFASNPRPTWVYDCETLRFLAVNPAAMAHYGWAEAEFLSMTLVDIRPAEDHASLRSWTASVGDVPATSLRRHVTKEGREIDVQLASHPLTFGERRARLVVAEDVTDRRRVEAQLQDLAVRDPLTGLVNRRGFEQLAAHEIATARRTHRTDALLYLDLDGFKAVNDTFGHAEGDDALRAVAAVLRATVRDHDVVARLGGDELVVYVAGLPRAGEGEHLAARLEAALEAHNREAAAAGRRYRLAFSAGLAELTSTDTLATLLERADAALYAAKQQRYAAA